VNHRRKRDTAFGGEPSQSVELGWRHEGHHPLRARLIPRQRWSAETTFAISRSLAGNRLLCQCVLPFMLLTTHPKGCQLANFAFTLPTLCVRIDRNNIRNSQL
jgi:hypothetical protein